MSSKLIIRVVSKLSYIICLLSSAFCINGIASIKTVLVSALIGIFNLLYSLIKGSMSLVNKNLLTDVYLISEILQIKP